MTDIADGYTPTTAATDEPKGSKTVTKRDVNALLASFEPEAAVEPTPGEKERARRVGRLEVAVRNLAKNLEEWGVIDGTPTDAAGALRALQTVLKKSTAAINSLSDAKLGVGEPKTRAPRVKKPEQETVADQIPDPRMATGEEGSQDDQIAESNADEIARQNAEMKARLEEKRAARSGPPAAAEIHQQDDPRGPVDPNENDGF